MGQISGISVVVPGRTERVPSIVMQFAVWVSYKTDFVSVMMTSCVKFSADDGLYPDPTGLFLRISDNIRTLVTRWKWNRACYSC